MKLHSVIQGRDSPTNFNAHHIYRADTQVVSVPDPNPSQHGSHSSITRVILDVIRAGVGLGLAAPSHWWYSP